MTVAPLGTVAGQAASSGARRNGGQPLSARQISANKAARLAIAAAVLEEIPALPSAAPGTVRSVGGEVLHASRSRPVVRWDVADHGPDGTTRFSVVGKVYNKGGGDAAHALLATLRCSGFGGAFDVPIPLGWVAGRRLLLQSLAPAATLYDRMADLLASLPDVHRTGQWLARLHTVTDTDLHPLDPGFEAGKAEEYLARLTPAQPHLRWALRGIADRMLPRLQAAADGPLVPTHGDFQPKNVHLDAERVVVIDFDRAALAPAARDLGHFVGQALTMAAAAGHPFDGAAADWADAMLEGYLAAGGCPRAVQAAPAYVARTFLEVLFYRLVVRPVRDDSFAADWVAAAESWLDR